MVLFWGLMRKGGYVNVKKLNDSLLIMTQLFDNLIHNNKFQMNKGNNDQ